VIGRAGIKNGFSAIGPMIHMKNVAVMSGSAFRDMPCTCAVTLRVKTALPA